MLTTKVLDHEDSSDEASAWEMRHGVLVTFKYISVLVWRDLERQQVLLKHQHNRKQDEDFSERHSAVGVLFCSAKLAIKYLSAPSDDVVGVAAQTYTIGILTGA